MKYKSFFIMMFTLVSCSFSQTMDSLNKSNHNEVWSAVVKDKTAKEDEAVLEDMLNHIYKNNTSVNSKILNIRIREINCEKESIISVQQQLNTLLPPNSKITIKHKNESSNSYEGVKLSFELKNVTLKQICDEMSRQIGCGYYVNKGGVTFSYSSYSFNKWFFVKPSASFEKEILEFVSAQRLVDLRTWLKGVSFFDNEVVIYDKKLKVCFVKVRDDLIVDVHRKINAENSLNSLTKICKSFFKNGDVARGARLYFHIKKNSNKTEYCDDILKFLRNILSSKDSESFKNGFLLDYPFMLKENNVFDPKKSAKDQLKIIIEEINFEVKQVYFKNIKTLETDFLTLSDGPISLRDILEYIWTKNTVSHLIADGNLILKDDHLFDKKVSISFTPFESFSEVVLKSNEVDSGAINFTEQCRSMFPVLPYVYKAIYFKKSNEIFIKAEGFDVDLIPQMFKLLEKN